MHRAFDFVIYHCTLPTARCESTVTSIFTGEKTEASWLSNVLKVRHFDFEGTEVRSDVKFA